MLVNLSLTWSTGYKGAYLCYLMTICLTISSWPWPWMTRRPSWLRRQPLPDHSHCQPSLVYRHLIYSLILTQKQWLLTHCCAQNAFLQPCCQSCGEREQQIGYQLTNTTRASEGSQETKHWWGKPLWIMAWRVACPSNALFAQNLPTPLNTTIILRFSDRWYKNATVKSLICRNCFWGF